MRLDSSIKLVAACLLMLSCSPANGGDTRQFQRPPPEEQDIEDQDDAPPAAQGGAKNKGGNAGASGKAGSKSQDAGLGGSKGGAAGSPSSGGTSGAAGQGPAGAGGAGGSGGAACIYPSSGYGNDPGQVVDSSVAWVGYEPGASSPTNISIQDFFDCDGSLGIRAVLLIYGAGWCPSCQQEASQLPWMMQSWGPAGVQVISLLVETSGGSPATAQTAKQWKDAFDLGDLYVAADPYFQLQSWAADSYPYKVLIDPRTMTIVSTYTGEGGDDEVLQLALKNK